LSSPYGKNIQQGPRLKSRPIAQDTRKKAFVNAPETYSQEKYLRKNHKQSKVRSFRMTYQPRQTGQAREMPVELSSRDPDSGRTAARGAYPLFRSCEAPAGQVRFQSTCPQGPGRTTRRSSKLGYEPCVMAASILVAFSKTQA
jgi:hypothetical protein